MHIDLLREVALLLSRFQSQLILLKAMSIFEIKASGRSPSKTGQSADLVGISLVFD
ncbi:hypothetical protein IMCC1989_1284 [gamma proteobacterium IMCC1989]|nr:hypothetical protein IMCC1989_1284 [gamma proteobacterium IMCC1989]